MTITLERKDGRWRASCIFSGKTIMSAPFADPWEAVGAIIEDFSQAYHYRHRVANGFYDGLWG